MPSPEVIAIGAIFWLVFFSFITWNELRVLVKLRMVVADSIAMAISTYLYIALSWNALYIVIDSLQPNAFSFGGGLSFRQLGRYSRFSGISA